MHPYIRMSRLSHPRASIGAIILLTVVFLAFGAVADQSVNATESAVMTSETLIPADNLGSSQ